MIKTPKLGNSKLEAIARETKFIVREKKLTSQLFLDLLFYGIEQGVKSLEQISKNASNEHSLHMSKQAFDKRFTNSSAAFVKKLLDGAIASQLGSGMRGEGLDFFNTVKIKDSTVIEIDPALASHFEGFGKGGGPNSQAAIRIQLEFDIKDFSIAELEVTSALQHDSSNAIEKEDQVEKGDLLLRDLGYYSNGSIKNIVKKGAYLISKLYPNVAVRLNEEDKEKVDFGKIFRQMEDTQNTCLDMDIFIGKKKLPARMVLVMLPEDVYEKRIRERNKVNKDMGYQTSQEYIDRARFNIFISNVPREILSDKEICNLYRIRWQVEIVFKTWKSIMKIERMRKMKTARFTTLIYAKLLWIFINWHLFSCCRNEFYRTEKKLLSIYKCFMTLSEHALKLRSIFRFEEKNVERNLNELVDLLSRKHWLEKRRKRYNLEEIIDLIF